MIGEFDLIKKYFAQSSPANILGVGDDCAVFSPAPNHRLATSKDLLIENTHFFSDVNPYALGYKSLAVNLSDLAAMGAKPLACLLGLGLPTVDEAWVKAFADGFYTLANRYHCPLIGGDTTRSHHEKVISVTVFGELPAHEPLLARSQAQVGDHIWVSGPLGLPDIALELLYKQHRQQSLSPFELDLLQQTRHALETPEPRIALGQALRGIAHAMIDISDGLLQDLGHILTASQVGAVLQESDICVAPPLHTLASSRWQQAVFSGGDVYELCFTASPNQLGRIQEIGLSLNLPLQQIGCITQELGLSVTSVKGDFLKLAGKGFDHFA